MKRLSSNPWARVIASVLLVLLVWICVFNCFAMAFLSEHQTLYENRPGAEEELIAELMQRDLRNLELTMDLSENVAESIFGGRFDAILKENYGPEVSNFLFTLYNEEGEILAGNEIITKESAVLVNKLQLLDLSMQRTVIRKFRSETAVEAFELALQEEYPPEDYSCEFNWEWQQDNSILFTGKLIPIIQCRLNASIREPMTARDRYYYAIHTFRLISRYRVLMIVITPVMVVSIFILLTFLLIGAGRRRDSDQFFIRWPDKIPFDVFVLLVVLLAAAPRLLLRLPAIRSTLKEQDHLFWILFVALTRIFRIVLYLWLLISFTRRCKTHTLVRNLLSYRIFVFLKKTVQYVLANLSGVWRGLVIWSLLSVFEGYYVIFNTSTVVTIIWVIEKALVTMVGTVMVINFQKLERGSRAMRRGELDTKVNLSWMFPLLRRHGENLNGISDALKRSLAEQMRSERMQSELITNVSHDIKTPLTSIISYVELLKKDGLDSPHAEEYLEVLDRQSDRLKKLVGDLVEASKVASGSISVEPECIDGNLLLTQVAGEYTERLEQRGLIPVYDLCAEPLEISADPNLLWRVFDNLMNNALKYAQTGTRIYLTTEIRDGGAVICFRNISDQMLNISPDELMERFVRGDSSRNTEGSGLGLSIAKNLTELQGGSFALSIDGDLFKILIGFPLASGDKTGESDA